MTYLKRKFISQATFPFKKHVFLPLSHFFLAFHTKKSTRKEKKRKFLIYFLSLQLENFIFCMVIYLFNAFYDHVVHNWLEKIIQHMKSYKASKFSIYSHIWNVVYKYNKLYDEFMIIQQFLPETVSYISLWCKF